MVLVEKGGKGFLDLGRILDDEAPGRDVDALDRNRSRRPPHLRLVLEQGESHRVRGVDLGIQEDVGALSLLRRGLGGGDRVDLFELGFERFLDLDAGDAHLEGQGPGRVVVGRDGRPAGVLPHVGVLLFLEQGPGVGLVGLSRLDHERAGAVKSAPGDEVGPGLMDLDAARFQDLEHLERRRIVPLKGRDDESVGLTLVDLLDGVLVHLVKIEEEVFLVQAGRLDHALRQDELVVDDVAEPPPAARPGVDEVHPFFVVAIRDLVRFDVDRGGGPDRGGFAEDADDIVEPGRVVAGADPPGRVGAAVDDAAQAVLLEVVAHLRADQVDPPPDHGLDVRQGRVHEGRDEEPGARRAHLVLVDVDLGQPVVVKDLGHGPGLGQVEHVPVAVVVVAGVVVVEPGHAAALVLGADVFPVPVDDHLVAVRVVARHEEDDDVVEDLAGVEEGPAGDEVVGELHRHL